MKPLWLFFLLGYVTVYSQTDSLFIDRTQLDVIDIQATYLKHDSIYSAITQKPFTGLAQEKKGNGQIIVEDYVQNGVLIASQQYYRGQAPQQLYAQYLYLPNKPFAFSKIMRYRSSGELYEIEYYNSQGKKRLVENYQDSKLTYSCEYNDKKRHGKELCITKSCDTTLTYYVNGKKLKK